MALKKIILNIEQGILNYEVKTLSIFDILKSIFNILKRFVSKKSLPDIRISVLINTAT